MSVSKLESLVELRKSIEDHEYNDFILHGTLNCVTQKYIQEIINLWDDCIDEIYDLSTRKNYFKENINECIGSNVRISIKVGNISNYYETFSDFVISNKILCKNAEYYIFEFDFFAGKTVPTNDSLKKYLISIELIDLLKYLSDYQKEQGSNLELFFYKTTNAISLSINYSPEDLISINLFDLSDLKDEFKNKADSSERRKIFNTELISLLNKKERTYKTILSNWEQLHSNYIKSFNLYLEGFSFEKIKTASIEYFHQLTDRINDTIAKVSNYIFAIPIAYIFLLAQLDAKAKSIVKDSLLLLLGFIFFVLMWFVFFKNITESLNAIEKDIDDFKMKIKNNNDLEEINSKLDDLKNITLKKQRNKLDLSKVLSITILAITSFGYFYLYFISCHR